MKYLLINQFNSNLRLSLNGLNPKFLLKIVNLKILSIKLIEFYQMFLSFDKGILAVLAPGGACKYFPTCSEYTKQMVKKYGSFRGLILGGRRILSCR